MNTTTESTDLKEIVLALNTCIEACTDGEKGYALAAADTLSPALKELFLQRSIERADVVSTLQKATRDMHGNPESQGSTRGTLHRGWVGLRKVLEGRSDLLVVEEVIRGEEAALNAYQDAIYHALKGRIPEDVRTLLEAQSSSIVATVTDLRGRKSALIAALEAAEAKSSEKTS